MDSMWTVIGCSEGTAGKVCEIDPKHIVHTCVCVYVHGQPLCVIRWDGTDELVYGTVIELHHHQHWVLPSTPALILNM